MHFQPSILGSVGVELELQIIDPLTLDLRDGILPIMDRIGESAYVRPELLQDCVEIGTRVCFSAADIEEHLVEVASALHRDAQRLGMTLCGAGTHPFCRRLARMTPTQRYRKQASRAGYLAHLQQVFATHVHVGVRSGPEAIAVMRELRLYLPVLLAIAANSPFWRGNETQFASYRHRILAATRSYGIPPSFASWQQFCEFLRTMRRARLFASVKDIHWDIRPQPALGTVELRVMDAQSQLRHVAQLAALIRALVVYLTRGERAPGLPRPLPWWIEKENHFQASRLGMSADYVRDAGGAVGSLRTLCHHVIASVREVAEELGDGPYLEALRSDLLLRPGYRAQRQALALHGSFHAVVEERIADLVSALTPPRAPESPLHAGRTL